MKKTVSGLMLGLLLVAMVATTVFAAGTISVSVLPADSPYVGSYNVLFCNNPSLSYSCWTESDEFTKKDLEGWNAERPVVHTAKLIEISSKLSAATGWTWEWRSQTFWAREGYYLVKVK